ncbi:MAG: hypothetical protein ACM3ZB_05300 [bacterium]
MRNSFAGRRELAAAFTKPSTVNSRDSGSGPSPASAFASLVTVEHIYRSKRPRLVEDQLL